jgi:hypothetical protein
MDGLDTIRSAFFASAVTPNCPPLAGIERGRGRFTHENGPGHRCPGPFTLSCDPASPGESADAYAWMTATSLEAAISGAAASTAAPSSPSAPNITSLYR